MIVTVIIPIYNEKTSLSLLLSEVLAADTSPYKKEILIVDDGSTDGSSEIMDTSILRDPRITIFHHPSNIGKAAAIKTGLQAAKGDIILIQDGDLEYSPHDYPRLLAPFSDPAVEAVYGSRFLGTFWPANMQAANWVANRIFTGTVNLLYRSHITDEGTAYKAFRRKTLVELGIESSGFEFCPEVTSKILKKGIKIIEVPISYKARTRSEGKKPGIFDGLKILWTIIKCRFRKQKSS